MGFQSTLKQNWPPAPEPHKEVQPGPEDQDVPFSVGATDAARFIGCSVQLVVNRSARGELPFKLDGLGKRRYLLDQLQPFVIPLDERVATEGSPPRESNHTPALQRPITFRKARNLMGLSAQRAIEAGTTTPEEIRDQGLRVLQSIAADSTVDDRTRCQAANALAALGSAESRARKFSSAADDLTKLSDEELAELQAMVRAVKKRSQPGEPTTPEPEPTTPEPDVEIDEPGVQ